ncbi:unnamed protein product [Angiostrongylus costaricensis]|uniref:Kunitz/Bovine pancreatic trypsin inhibitor domain protein n=1 Tax=Angiostrongylus costaricensis TaxID=334426 RepID=A0A158PJE1_ANGCS|nr:unnamed protein product [Angiostrongylus costaricensis]
MEDHRPMPCQPRPWLPEQRCPTGFWCHEGEDEASYYCCQNNRKGLNRCHLPPAVGFGKPKVRRFYYDPTIDGCHALYYTGIGGNENNFVSYEQCEQTCRGYEPPKVFRPMSSSSALMQVTRELSTENETLNSYGSFEKAQPAQTETSVVMPQQVSKSLEATTHSIAFETFQQQTSAMPRTLNRSLATSTPEETIPAPGHPRGKPLSSKVSMLPNSESRNITPLISQYTNVEPVVSQILLVPEHQTTANVPKLHEKISTRPIMIHYSNPYPFFVLVPICRPRRNGRLGGPWARDRFHVYVAGRLRPLPHTRPYAPFPLQKNPKNSVYFHFVAFFFSYFRACPIESSCKLFLNLRLCFLSPVIWTKLLLLNKVRISILGSYMTSNIDNYFMNWIKSIRCPLQESPMDNISACLSPMYDDVVIMCALESVQCPAGTFCQIGDGQSICCPTPIGNKCEQAVRTGVGPSSLPRWYFDPTVRECLPFLFRGFQVYDAIPIGSSSFAALPTLLASHSMCYSVFSGKIPTACDLPVISGHGNQFISRFFFSNDYGQCLHFIYSGEGGNSNNFASIHDCHQTCMGTENQYLCKRFVCTSVNGMTFCCQTPESFCLHPRPPLSVCFTQFSPPVQRIEFTYDPLADRCVQFSYSSCSPSFNLNHFKSSSQCTRLCCNQVRAILQSSSDN